MPEPGKPYRRPIRNLSREERASRRGDTEPYRYPEENLANIIKEALFIHGKLIGQVTLGAAETEILHELGSTDIGWLVLSQDASASIFEVPLTFPPPVDEDEAEEQGRLRRSKILLKASATVNVKLWVFSSYQKPTPPPPRKKPVVPAD